jgi:hypothetical protein
MSVEDFLKSQYYNEYQTESCVGFGELDADRNRTRRRFFHYRRNRKFKDIIWNYDAPATADVETGTIKEGMDSGLTYKAYSGYVDKQVSNKNYFNDKSLKTSGGKPITGVELRRNQ